MREKPSLTTVPGMEKRPRNAPQEIIVGVCSLDSENAHQRFAIIVTYVSGETSQLGK